MASWLARALGASLFGVLVGLLLALAIIYARWRPFVARARQISPPTATAWEEAATIVGAETLNRLGSLVTQRRSLFSNFPRAKPQGTFRVCAFGDSFTYGSEVADDFDYPAQLQVLFERRGMENVQVLNFGNSGWGLGQSYVMWDDVGRSYDCDFLLLGPRGWYRDRDATFQHARLRNPYQVHARFILNGGDLQLIEPAGADYQERFERYWRFLPEWRYLRYDRQPPAFLQAFLGATRTRPNPFYYSPIPVDDETELIYRRLMSRFADSGLAVVAAGPATEIAAFRSLERPSFTTLEHVFRSYEFPMWSGAHYSPWGNRRVAEHYFAAVVDAGDPLFPGLAFSDLDAEVPADDPGPLWKWERVEVHFGGESFARLKPGRAALPAGTEALLFIREPWNRVASWVLPLPSTPSEGSEVALWLDAESRVEPLGALRRLNRRAYWIEVEWSLRTGEPSRSGVTLRSHTRLPPDTEAAVRIGDAVVLRGRTDGSGEQLLLSSDLGGPLWLDVDGSHFDDPYDLPEAGTADLVLAGPGAREWRAPVAAWRKVWTRPNPPDHDLANRLVRTAGGAGWSAHRVHGD